MQVNYHSQGWGPHECAAPAAISDHAVVSLSDYRGAGNPPRTHNAMVTFNFHHDQLMADLAAGEITRERYLQRVCVLVYIAKHYMHLPPDEVMQIHETLHGMTPA